MPELPEVEFIRSCLAKHLLGKRVTDLRLWRSRVLQETSVSQLKRAILGSRILRVRRRGKFILVDLDSGFTLLFHMRMRGRFLLQTNLLTKKGEAPLPCRRASIRTKTATRREGTQRDGLRLLKQRDLPFSAEIAFALDDREILFFGDIRHLARVQLLPGGVLEEVAPLSRMGPEPLSPLFTLESLRSALNRSKQPLKPWLMNPRHIAGIGNIYAAEILFDAKITPIQIANRLKSQWVPRLYRSIAHVLLKAISFSKRTLRDIHLPQDWRQEVGGVARVYRRKGLPCLRCGHRIQAISQRGRTTYFCPRCQRLRS